MLDENVPQLGLQTEHNTGEQLPNRTSHLREDLMHLGIGDAVRVLVHRIADEHCMAHVRLPEASSIVP